jgi:hypothetical protein
MEKKFTSKKKTMWTHLMWLGVLVVSVILFAKCYEFTMIDQPSEAGASSSFQTKITIKGEAEADFNHQLTNYGSFGVELPDGWTVDDSIPFNIKGTYVTLDPFVDFSTNGFIIHQDSASQMFEDSVGSAEGYFWWGGVTDAMYYFDNLDSATVTVTINTGDEAGEFHLRYGVGDYDFWKRVPIDEDGAGGALSEAIPITIWPVNVEKYFRNDVSIFPNPAYDVLNVHMAGIRTGNIQLYDISGKLQYERNITSKETTFNVSDLVSGIYILKLNTDLGEHTEKVLIK